MGITRSDNDDNDTSVQIDFKTQVHPEIQTYLGTMLLSPSTFSLINNFAIISVVL